MNDPIANQMSDGLEGLFGLVDQITDKIQKKKLQDFFAKNADRPEIIKNSKFL